METLVVKWLQRSRYQDFSSSSYWDERYRTGGTSGAGSYGNLANFKAQVINEIILASKITSGLEFGCGDGNNLKLYNFTKYTGVDVSNKALEICRRKFEHDSSKRFIHYSESSSEKAEITLSMDVIFHLVEDQVFLDYMDRLFGCSQRFVLIYSSCVNYRPAEQHVRHRNFLKLVADRYPEWQIVQVVPNKYPAKDITVQEDGFSFSDFYLFAKAS